MPHNPIHLLTDQAERLNKLLIKSETPRTLSLDAPWGFGKTTFVKETFLPHIKNNEEYLPIYINLWQIDIMDDPFLAIISEIHREIKSQADSNEVVNDALNRTAQAALKVLKVTSNLLFYGAVAAAAKNIELVKEDTADLYNILTGKSAEQETTQQPIEDYINRRDAIDNLKAAISELAEIKRKKIVIFADDLDRCLPSNANLILHRIAHVFDTKGVLFVLMIDRNQLAGSLNSLFGKGWDSHNYLRRFINTTFVLNHYPVLHHIIKETSKEIKNKTEDENLEQKVHNFMSCIIQHGGLSARDAQDLQFCIEMSVEKLFEDYHEDTHHDKNLLYDILFSLIYLKAVDYTLYIEIAVNAGNKSDTFNQCSNAIQSIVSNLPDHLYNFSLPSSGSDENIYNSIERIICVYYDASDQENQERIIIWLKNHVRSKGSRKDAQLHKIVSMLNVRKIKHIGSHVLNNVYTCIH